MILIWYKTVRDYLNFQNGKFPVWKIFRLEIFFDRKFINKFGFKFFLAKNFFEIEIILNWIYFQIRISWIELFGLKSFWIENPF